MQYTVVFISNLIFEESSFIMKDIYNDHTYLNNNPTWHEEDAPFKAGKIIELLQRNPIAFETVAEIGCGSGEILVNLEKSLPNVSSFYGYDISTDAINIAQRKETDKTKFLLKDIVDTRENYFYDLLLVIDVIEHVDNYFKFLEGIVSKGRYTIFHIPLDMCMWSLFREQMLVESKNRIGHIHNFTEDFIKAILEDHGFQVIDQIYTPPSFKHFSFKQKTINTLRKLLFKINKKFCTKTLGGYSILLLTKNKNQKYNI
jgi:predicted RNA methylase